MKHAEARIQFIETWASLGTQWGINKTMAQIHALLLISNVALSTEDIMDELAISRGNANMNTRALIDWGLVQKIMRIGERKEFFEAEKDMWKISTQIMNMRRQRELLPLRKSIKTLKNIEDSSPEAQSFKYQMEEIERFSDYADKMLNRMMAAQENWMVDTLKKIILK